MKYIPLALLFVSSLALAKQVELNGEYGCVTTKAHTDRVALLKKSMTTDDSSLKSEYNKEIVRISKYDCSPLNGKFKVLKQTKDFYQVQYKDEKLWLMR